MLGNCLILNSSAIEFNIIALLNFIESHVFIIADLIVGYKCFLSFPTAHSKFKMLYFFTS